MSLIIKAINAQHRWRERQKQRDRLQREIENNAIIKSNPSPADVLLLTFWIYKSVLACSYLFSPQADLVTFQLVGNNRIMWGRFSCVIK